MTHQLRRAIPREFVDWIGSYQFEHDQNGRSRRCRVIDLSTSGAGLELLETTAGEDLGGLITVSIDLHGEVRNALPNDIDNTARIGIEFSGLSDEAEAYVRSVSGVRSRW